jgi:hypothetical protein
MFLTDCWKTPERSCASLPQRNEASQGLYERHKPYRIADFYLCDTSFLSAEILGLQR